MTFPGGHKPGIIRDLSEHGRFMEFSGNFVQPQGKIDSRISSKTTVDWVSRIIMFSESSDPAQ